VISVVIATFNRRHLLERTLRALEEQSVPKTAFEVVIADNGSSDGTADLLAAVAARGRLDLRVLRVTDPGKSAALNVAVARARGDLLVFTDDDVLPEPGWLAAFADAFATSDADFAAGRIFPIWESPPPAWLSPGLYGVLAVPDGGPERRRLTGLSDPTMPIGTNMAVRRRVIERLGGWRTDLGKLRGTLRTGEDHEFYARMLRSGCVGIYEPEARVRHLVPAERMRRAYFREWFHGYGRIVALLEPDFPTTTRYLLGVPRYLWRGAAADLAGGVRAVVSGDPAMRLAREVRLRWFLGYLQQSWGSRLRPSSRVPAAVCSSC